MVYRGELEYIQSIEPENETRWKNAMGSHLTQWTSALERMFVVEHQAEAMGYCFWQEDKGEAVLASIFVKSQQRQQGLGRLLLDQFMLDAFAAGFAKLTLGVYHNNPARFLYESAGFQRIREDAEYLYYEYPSASPAA